MAFQNVMAFRGSAAVAPTMSGRSVDVMVSLIEARAYVSFRTWGPSRTEELSSQKTVLIGTVVDVSDEAPREAKRRVPQRAGMIGWRPTCDAVHPHACGSSGMSGRCSSSSPKIATAL